MEDVKIRLVKYAGRRSIDIRRYFNKKDSEELRPTKEGVQFPIPELDSVITLLDQIEKSGCLNQPDTSLRSALARSMNEVMSSWVIFECAGCLSNQPNQEAHVGNSCLLSLPDKLKHYMERLLTQFNVEDFIAQFSFAPSAVYDEYMNFVCNPTLLEETIVNDTCKEFVKCFN